MSCDARARNLSDFIAALPRTGVRFMHFRATDLTAPTVSAAFAAWDIGDAPCFVVPSDPPEHCHVYRESALARMLSPPVRRYDSAAHALASHGEHMAFGFVRDRADRIFLKIHKASYEEIADHRFDRRNEGECRFASPNAPEATSLDRFAGLLCDTPRGRCSLKAAFATDALVPEIVYALYRCIARNGRKKYDQRGAAPDYKGITFISPAFVRFLSGTIFQPVASLRADLVAVQVFFDELSELARDGNRTLLILYDFEEGERSAFYVRMETAFAAAYAAENPGAATAYETTCLQQFLAAVAHPTTGLAASVAPL